MLFRVLLPALVAALTIGCQGLPSAHHTWIAPTQAKSVSRFVEVHGAVALAGSQPIPQGGLTLAEAIKNAGGVAQSNTDAAGSAGTLVCLRRQSQAAYFALPLVADGPVGAIQLAAGDRINVGPWTATGLFRGLKATDRSPATPSAIIVQPLPEPANDISKLADWTRRIIGSDVDNAEIDRAKAEKNPLLAAEILGRVVPNNSPAPPKDQGDIGRWRDEFAASVVQLMRTRLQPRPREPYELDWPALRKYYGVTEAAPSPIKIAVALTAGDTNETQAIERQVKFVGPDQSHPSLLPITQTRFSQDPVVVLRRVEEATLTTYVLNAAWSVQMSGPLANAASAMLNEPARRLLSWIRVLDGDDIEITDPRRMPIVAAGMIAPLVHSVVKSNRPLPSPAPIAAIHCDVQWPRLVP